MSLRHLHRPPKHPLLMNGERFLLPASLGVLAVSALLSVAVIWRLPKVFLALGIYGLIFSPAFWLIACWEVVRYQRGWRTLLALLILSIATAISWGTTILYATGRLR